MYKVYSNGILIDNVSNAYPSVLCFYCMGLNSACDHNMIHIWDTSSINNRTGSEVAADAFKALETIGKFGLVSLDDHQKHATLWSDGYVRTKTGAKLDDVSGLLKTLSLNLRRLMLKALNSPNNVFTVELTEWSM